MKNIHINPSCKQANGLAPSSALGLLIIALLGLLPNTLHAQDYLSDMKKMQEAYKQISNLHSKVSVKVFTEKGAASPVFVQHLELWKKGEQLHYNMGELTMVTGKKYTLWINEGNREIAVQKNASTKKSKEVTELLSPELEKAMQEHNQIAYLGKKQGLKVYRIQQKEGDIAQADIFLDHSGFLKRMEYLYRTGTDGSQHYVEVVFTEFNTNATPNEQLFNEKRYITDKGGKLAPTPSYTSYQLVTTKSEIDENE